VSITHRADVVQLVRTLPRQLLESRSAPFLHRRRVWWKYVRLLVVFGGQRTRSDSDGNGSHHRLPACFGTGDSACNRNLYIPSSVAGFCGRINLA